jgi:hypothetical protein
VTPSLCLRARRQWLAAYRKRTGNLCILSGPKNPAYVIDKNGYGVDFCDN